nr:uncharacterized protein LOC108945176 [Nicotiana tomentosiformis]
MSRNTREYLLGLNQFLEFAFKNGAIRDRIKCPYPKCDFRKWQTKDIVFDHLIGETGRRLGRAQLYLYTLKKLDGTYLNDAAKEICEKIEFALSQSTVDESEVSPNDVIGKVLGKEHSRRPRDAASGSLSPMDARRSSDGSNPSDNN